MGKSSNVEVVKKFFVVTFDGKYDEAFRHYVGPEYTWIVSTDNNPELRQNIPWAGYKHVGKQGWDDLMRMLFGEFEVLVFETVRFFDAGSTVFVQGRFRFRHKTTGKTAESDWLARFEMNNGRIAEGQIYENTFGVAKARAQ